MAGSRSWEADGGFWRGRRVLVTGGTGFLGSHVIGRLVAAGALVACLVRQPIPSQRLAQFPALARTRSVVGDLKDGVFVRSALGEYGIQTVFHLGAQTIVGIANKDPVTTFETNIQGTWSVLEGARLSGVEQVVVASSDKAYGDHEKLPYEETAPLQGQHPYDVSKSCADLIARAYAVSFGLNVAITRCGNFYGPGDLNWNRIVPGTVRAVVEGKRPVIRSDGLNVRDYFHVEDGAAANVLLAEQLGARTDLKGEAFNFSNETQVTVLELVKRILGIMGSELEPEVRNEASNEIRSQYLSAAKARRVLGWEPLYTLDSGLKDAIEWYRKELETAAAPSA
jgi:CDP-glucose 4,6-dehydratase